MEGINLSENINNQISIQDQNEDLSVNKQTYDFYLLIYNIAKKHNIGTLIRSASAFNIKKILVLGENKKILKKFFGSQGTVKKTEFLFFNDVQSIKDFCKENKIYICGIEIGAECKPIHTQPFKGNTLFVLGNEGSGMNNKQKEMCDHLVYIPQYSTKTGSLNVAIAASIVFHHFAVWAQYSEAKFTEEKYNVEYQVGNVEFIDKEINKEENYNNDVESWEKNEIHRHNKIEEKDNPIENLIEDFKNL